MNCRKCQAELDEGVTLCPVCGCDNAPEEDTVAQVPANDEVPPMEEAIVEEEPKTEESPETPEVPEAPASEKTEIKEGKLTPGKIALLVALAVAAIAVIAALVVSSFSGGQRVESPSGDPTATSSSESTGTEDDTETTETTEATIPADTGLNDTTCKGSYTVSDEELLEQADTVVATLGDAQLTNSQLQVYYWMQFYDFMNNYGSYASLFGLDYTQPLDTQLSPDGVQTWQQYFLNAAVNLWHSYSALSMDAEEANYQMEADLADYLENLPQTLEDNAAAAGFESANAMVQADMGAGATLDGYIQYMNDYYLGYLYYNSLVEAIELTDQEIEDYYTENEATFVENGVEKTEDVYVAVRHVLISPEGGTTGEDGTVTYSDEEWETARATAQSLLEQWAAGEATEEAFAQLANEHSMDTGSNTNGGLYENVAVGQMVEPFENWCFDESRKYGDSGLVQTDYGYHIMFFVDSEPIWFAEAREELLTNRSTEILESAMSRYTLDIDYSKIVLGFVDLSGETE